MTSVKKHLLLLSRFAITILVIFIIWLSLKDHIDELITTLRSVNKFYLCAGFILYVCTILFLSIRLKTVLSTQRLVLSLKESIRLNFIGFFFNSFLPTAIGGDVARGYYASERFSHKKVECYAAVFADRTIGLVSILCIALISLFIVSGEVVTFSTKISILTIFALVIFSLFILLNKRFASKFKFLLPLLKLVKLEKIANRSYKVFNNFRHYKGAGLFSLFIAFMGQVLVIIVCFILSKSLNLNLPFSIFFLFIPLISAASMIPSLGGTGPREGAFIVLFGKFIGNSIGDVNQGNVLAGALALLWLSYFLGLSLMGGLVYLLSGYHRLTMSEIEKEISYDRQRTA